MAKNLPEMFAKLSTAEGGEGGGGEGTEGGEAGEDGAGKEGSKRQTRGGKAAKANKKKSAGGAGKEPEVKLASSSRGKRTTTLVFGLSTCGEYAVTGFFNSENSSLKFFH